MCDYEQVVLGSLGSESIQFPRVGVQFKLYLPISEQTEEEYHDVQFVVGIHVAAWRLNHQKMLRGDLPFLIFDGQG